MITNLFSVKAWNSKQLNYKIILAKNLLISTPINKTCVEIIDEWAVNVQFFKLYLDDF